jgi:pyruvate,water dikinase
MLVRARHFVSTWDGLVVFLAGEAAHSAADLGAKAYNLQVLIRHHLPVPPGFCISSQAYRQHLLSGDLPHVLERSLAQLGPNSNNCQAQLATLRQAIVDQPLSTVLLDGVEEAYRKLGNEAVAVRSSAIAEDLPGHSFAGQYDTYLGVAGLDTLVTAVKSCWASLWTDRAFQYRVKNGFCHDDAAMAVLVQKLIDANASGILFTIDPLDAHRDRLVIEGSFGLGEAVVGGKVNPDRIVLARKNLRILERTVSEKSLAIVREGNGVREVKVDEGRSRTPCLDETTARRLAGYALRAESILGGPQDIEWATSRESIYLLQSRPITVDAAKNSWHDRQVWSNHNSGEILPDVASPLTWSLVQFLIQRIFGETLGKLGLEFDANQLIGLVAGRVYFNLNTFSAIFGILPGFKGLDTYEMFGGAGRHERPELRPEDLPNFKVRWGQLLWNLPGFLAWTLTHSTHRGLAFANAMRRRLHPLEQIDLGGLSEKRLAALFDFLRNNPQFHGETIAYSMVGAMCFPQLFVVCRRWLGDADGSLANRLLAGMGNMDSAESGFALWRLSEMARVYPEVEKAILRERDFQTVRSYLPKRVGGSEFLAGWDEFMARHGHHTRGEIDIMNPRWRETPDFILNVLRSYLHRGKDESRQHQSGEAETRQNTGGIAPAPQASPLAVHHRLASQRRELAAACRGRLKNPIKRLVFSSLLDQAQRGCRVRENVKSEVVRMLALVRSLVQNLGARLAERGALGSAEDIFFLRLEEIDPVRRNHAAFDVPATIAARRADYLKNLTLTPPSIVVGRFDPATFSPEVADTKARVLSGLAVSPGVASGRARVILRSDSREQVLPGEILVAPFTDPGWTPHFLNAAAIVMDLGGLLSHGSIIAREYGIPAVVNVPDATRLIQTGQTVHVDGLRGEVRLV